MSFPDDPPGSFRVPGCDAPTPSAYMVPGSDEMICRCVVCARCGHHTGNSHQGHWWAHCKVMAARLEADPDASELSLGEYMRRSCREFHMCCPPPYGCELEEDHPDRFMSCPCGRSDYAACGACPYAWCSVHGDPGLLSPLADADVPVEVADDHVPVEAAERADNQGEHDDDHDRDQDPDQPFGEVPAHAPDPARPDPAETTT